MQLRGCKYLASPPVIVSLTIVGLVSLVAGPVAAELRPNWHPGVRAALEAAVQSGKPVYVYIEGAGLPKCVKMEQQSLCNPQVVTALGRYEMCRLNVYDRQNEAYLRQYKILESREGEAKAKMCELPAHLFLNKQGQQICRFHGYWPPQWFIRKLGSVQSVVTAHAAVQANPWDAAAHAQLGHLYLQWQMYGEARVYLNKAVALDPNNKAGAKAEAQVDLNILAIADNPQQAYSELAKHLKNYPQSPRRLEVRYYMAVAQVAVGNTNKAIEILKTFETSDESAPEYNSPWATPALLLLKSLRQYTGQ